MTRIVSWFSCGAASAVATKKTIEKYGDRVIVASCVVENEHPDNERFLIDCEKWFGLPVLRLRSQKYKDCWEVWEKRRFLVGPKGALCTTEMKKMVRQKFQKPWSDIQIFGFTIEEVARAERFNTQNPEANLETPLISLSLSKNDCFRIIKEAGIELPVMYHLGYKNNNCIGCVKGGAGYWNKIRKDFPEVFERMSKLERSLGRTITKFKGKRTFLDELPVNAGAKQKEPDMECGLFCKGEK